MPEDVRGPKRRSVHPETTEGDEETKVSVVLPVYNEAKNLQDLYVETKSVLEANFEDWEFVFVDDGSTDGSYDVLRELLERNDDVKVVRFRTNFGQSEALDAGVKYATGDVFVTMDADGQNDPADIPALVEELGNGYDCVCGWRRDRNDSLEKRVLSEIARRLRVFVLGTDLHDYGCTLKAFNAEAAAELDIMGEMHRYIPPLLNWRGYRVGEIVVNHRPRENGQSKYGLERIGKGFVDLLNVWFWQKYSTRPLHVFGGLGLASTAVGLLCGVYTVYLKVVEGASLSDTALPLLTVFLVILGIQFFISGILADIQVKDYYSSSGKENYRIESVSSSSEVQEQSVKRLDSERP